MKYDDASWHSGGDFPGDLPSEAAATHTGMFLAWALLSGKDGDLHSEGSPAPIEKLRTHSVTPGEYFLSECDGKFTDEDLNNEGNAFAADYYALETGQFLRDYEATLGAELPTLYHIADSWQNFDKLKPILDRRFQNWRSARHNQSNSVKSGANTVSSAGVTALDRSRATARFWLLIGIVAMICALLFLVIGFFVLGSGVSLLPALIGMCVGLFCLRKADAQGLARAEKEQRK
jgi:hypothetical protein